MIALDESTLSILETKCHLKTKSNVQGIQRVLFFLEQQVNKEKNQFVDTSSMLRAKRQIIETRKQQILDGLQLEKNRIGMAFEDAKERYHSFSQDRIHLTYLLSIYLQNEEMRLVHAKNKWLLRANSEFARQIMDDIAVQPMTDDPSDVELNAVIFSCQQLTKQILQKRYIHLEELQKFFIIYFEKQAIFLLQESSLSSPSSSASSASEIPHREKPALNIPGHVVRQPQDYLVYLEVQYQMEVMQILIPLFFPLLEIALQKISVDEVLEVSYDLSHQNSKRMKRSSITHLTSREEEFLTQLALLIPSGIQALHALLQILLGLLSKSSSQIVHFKAKDQPQKPLESLSEKKSLIISLILLIWKYAKSNIINPMMKWINLLIEYSFGNLTVFSKLSTVLIGRQTLRANLLLITHEFYHCILMINPLLAHLKEQQKQYQLQQLRQAQMKQHQRLTQTQTTAGLRKVMTRTSTKQSSDPARSQTTIAPPVPSTQDKRSSMNQQFLPPVALTVNPIFQLHESERDDSGRGTAATLFLVKYQFDNFLLNNFDPLIQISLELVELMINQNSMKMGWLGHVAGLCIQDPFFYAVYDHEMIACMNIVTDFYSQEILDSNAIANNSHYYEDGLDSCLLIIKELSIMIQHRYSSVFVCMSSLKMFLAAIGFYTNYYHLFSFDEKEYSIYQDAAYQRRLNITSKAQMRRKEEVKNVKKQLKQRNQSPLKELSSTVSDPLNNNSLSGNTRRKKNAFANELGQFAYRVLGILMLHHTSLNICHKGVLYLRYVMREQFLEKHFVEDLFSLPLQTMVDPWLASLALGVEDDEEEEQEIEEEEAVPQAPHTDRGGFSIGEGSYGSHSSPSQDDQSTNSFATQDSKLFPTSKHMPPIGTTRISPSPSMISTETSIKKESDEISEATSVTTKTNELNPAQYLLRMKRLYIPKTFKGETNIKKRKSQVLPANLQETMTLMDILVFISENHVQSNEVMEQLLLIVYQITMKSNLIKYLLVENNLQIAIQRFSENQGKTQSYVIALCELCLEALKI